MWEFTARDEGLHGAGAEPLWAESYYFDFADTDASFGGYVRLGLYPNLNRVWYWACLLAAGEPALMVVDQDAEISWLADGSEARIRGGGYRATQAFQSAGSAVRLTLDSARLGLELNWTTAEGIYPYRHTTRYEVPCRVDGSVRVAGRQVTVDGHGQRDHSWGLRDWWSLSWLWAAGRFADGTAVHAVQANLGTPPMPLAAYTAVNGEPPEHHKDLTAFTEFGPAGLPTRCELTAGGFGLAIVPTAYGPVELVSDGGENARFLRAMCRFEAPDGRRGSGWCEWHQPPGWAEHDWGEPPG
jgi:hypothetical protein